MENLKPYARQIVRNMFTNIKKPLNRIDDNDVYDNIDRLYESVINSDLAITSKRDRLIILNNIIKNEMPARGSEIYTKAREYNDTYIRTEQCQELSATEKQHYIAYDQLLDKLSELIQINKKSPSRRNMIRLLVLALYTLQPPIRNDYHDIKLNEIGGNKEPNTNYLYITADKYILYIDRDKVSNKTPPLIVSMQNNLLTSILDEYMITCTHKFKYLFQNPDGTPYTKRQINYILKSYFKSDNKVLTIFNLRSAYITDFYKKHGDIMSRDILARQMRHTRGTAELIYCKFF